MRRSILVVGAMLGAAASSAQEVRPVKDDVGFCWDPGQMERLVRFLDTEDTACTIVHPIVAGISPHDDYLYAGKVYHALFKSVRASEVVIFGVTHGTVRKEIGDPRGVILLDDFSKWKALGQDVPVSPLRDYIRTRSAGEDWCRVDRRAHELEHSIEALIPFFQYYNPAVAITPIMVTAMPFERMDQISDRLASLIAEYISERRLVPGKDIVFLSSSDANHYGKDFGNTPFGEDTSAHRQGTQLDESLAREFLTGSVRTAALEALFRALSGSDYAQAGRSLWCGRYSVPFGMLTAMKTLKKVTGKDVRGTLLVYSDTYSGGVLPLTQTGMGTTAPFSLKHWVGFFSAAYCLE